jgi:hypothetical protein
MLEDLKQTVFQANFNFVRHGLVIFFLIVFSISLYGYKKNINKQ